ncbi:MAG: glycosyltransferase family 2 protein [Opitutales bacterium]
MPAVSVLMPVYNGVAFLGPALDSICRQQAVDWELIAVDDGSTDKSGTILDRAAASDPRIRVFHTPNRGLIAALNLGLGEVRAERVARMDADDVAEPERLLRQCRLLEAKPDLIACGTWALMIDPEDRPIARVRPPVEHEAIVAALQAGHGTALIHPTLVARRSALEAIGGYHADWLHTEDFDLYLRLAEYGRLANLPEVLLRYRQHPGSVNARRAAYQRASIRARLAGDPPPPAPADRAGPDRPPDPVATRLHWARLAYQDGARANGDRQRALAWRNGWYRPGTWPDFFRTARLANRATGRTS